MCWIFGDEFEWEGTLRGEPIPMPESTECGLLLLVPLPEIRLWLPEPVVEQEEEVEDDEPLVREVVEELSELDLWS